MVRALPYNRLSFVQSASVARQTGLAGYVAYGESRAVQPVELRAVRFNYAAGGTSFMCCGQQEALPYNRFSFVQSASVLRRAERA